MTKAYSIEQVEQARVKILENSQELINESELLFENGKYARAYTLAHLACEEISKIPMLVNSIAQSIVYDDTNWTKLNKRLVNHREKFRSFMVKNIDEIDVFIKLLDVEPEELEGKLNILKNASLYTTNNKGEFRKPSEIITNEISFNMIKLSKDYYTYYLHAEELTKGKLTELQSNTEYKNRYKEVMDYVRKFPIETYAAMEVLKVEEIMDINYLKTIVELSRIFHKYNLNEEEITKILSPAFIERELLQKQPIENKEER